jgi:hypothetical protein
MKRFFSLLSLLLCFELIVSPMAPTLSLMGQKAYAESCASGFTWDANLNRCLTKTDTANVINATANCPAGDVQCYRTNAENELSKKESSGEVDKAVANKKGFVSTVMNAAAVAVPVTMAVLGLSTAKSTCASVSYWAMIGGGVSLFVGDMLANMQHKKRLKEIEKDWSKIIAPNAGSEADKDQQKTNATEAQSQSFEMLARSEDSMEKAAKMKSTFYAIGAAAFAAAAALAVLEATNTFTAAGSMCATASTTPYIHKQHIFNLKQARNLSEFYVLNMEMNNSYSSPSLEDFEKIKQFTKEAGIEEDNGLVTWIKDVTIKALSNLNPIATAKAQMTEIAATKGAAAASSAGTGISGTVSGWVSSAAASPVGQFLTNPWTRAGFGGVMAGWSLIMYKHASSQAEASRNRSEQLRKMRDEFKSASGAINQCNSGDRSDTSKPECYCYTSDGQRNPNRGSSQICQKLFSGKNLASGNYFGSDTAVKGCIDSSRSYDETCKCKATSSCMKATQGTVKGMDIGTLSMLGSSLAPVNTVATGSLDTASINSANLANNAARVIANTKKLENKAGLAFSKKKDQAAKAFEKVAMSAAAGMPSNLLGSNSAPLPANAGEAAAMLEKEIENAEITKVGGAGGLASPVSDSSGDQQLEFGLNNDQQAIQDSQVAEVMKENLDFGQSDINQGSNTNIFDVLSNRYQRSGMRRLFDEKGVTQPDKAASTDITQ